MWSVQMQDKLFIPNYFDLCTTEFIVTELPKQDINLLSQSLPQTRNHSYPMLLIEPFDIFLEICHLSRAIYSLSILF